MRYFSLFICLFANHIYHSYIFHLHILRCNRYFQSEAQHHCNEMLNLTDPLIRFCLAILSGYINAAASLIRIYCFIEYAMQRSNITDIRIINSSFAIAESPEPIPSPLPGICRPDQFQCASDGKCIEGYQKCNKQYNCADGSDEQSCPDVSEYIFFFWYVLFTFSQVCRILFEMFPSQRSVSQD